jgi:hypothetical protein
MTAGTTKSRPENARNFGSSYREFQVNREF